MPAGPAPHHGREQPGRRGVGRLDTAALPRPEGRLSGRQQSPCHGAAAPSLTRYAEQCYRHGWVGVICPGDRASIQPSQAPCLNLSNLILRLCTKLSILSGGGKKQAQKSGCFLLHAAHGRKRVPKQTLQAAELPTISPNALK